MTRLAPRKRCILDHGFIVRSVAFSPDGSFLISAGDKGICRSWNLTDGTLRHDFPKHSHDIYSVSMSPDGKRFVSASETWPGPKGEIRLWSLESGQLLAEPSVGLNISARVVAFSPDGRLLASGGYKNPMRIWSVSDWKTVQSFSLYQLLTLSFSPDSSILATGHGDNCIRIWDVRSGAMSSEWLSLEGAESIAFSPDGTLLASCGSGGTTRLWDVAERKERHIFMSDMVSLGSIAFLPDGRILAAGGLKGTTVLWDVSTGEEKARLGEHTGPIYTIAFSADGMSLATAGYDGIILIWDLWSKL